MVNCSSEDKQPKSALQLEGGSPQSQEEQALSQQQADVSLDAGLLEYYRLLSSHGIEAASRLAQQLLLRLSPR